MSLRRIVVFAPVFIVSLTAGLLCFDGTAAMAAYLKPAKRAIVMVENITPVQSASLVEPTVSATPIMEVNAAIKEEGTPAAPSRNEAETVDWHGVFSFDSESLPKAFRDMSHLEIVLYDYDKTDGNGDPGPPIPPKGFLHAGKEFKFKRIALAGKQIAFQTETVSGVSYRFTGKFLALDYCETDGRTPDVSGELIKIVDGKWAAAMKADLYEECGC